MDMSYVLLSSKGRIGSRTFLRGLSVITAAFILVQIANTFISPMFGILFYPMVYVYVCLFSKRLHDAGHSGWFYLLFLIGYAVVTSVVSAPLAATARSAACVPCSWLMVAESSACSCSSFTAIDLIDETSGKTVVYLDEKTPTPGDNFGAIDQVFSNLKRRRND